MFTDDDLLIAAGRVVFGRGEEYVQYVRGLRVEDGRASASVQAKRVYRVALRWGGELAGECTCPHTEQGMFCKHLVAVGLAVLVQNGSLALSAGDATADSAMRAFVDGLDRSAVTDLVMELVEADPAARQLVRARALAAGGTDAIDPAELVEAVSAALRAGFVDYRRSFDVARDVQTVLDDLERLLDAGAADAVRPALDRAMSRLRSVTMHADDSGGVVGDAYQRAADLHARSCREGRPDPAPLARWLVKFRSTSPGWPQLTLGMYVDAFDDGALAVYRGAVDRLDRKQSGADHFDRFEVDRMLLELADHDGDLDRAIDLLSRDPERTEYGAIVVRLRDGGRPETLDWLDRAVAAGRLDGPDRATNDYWISPRDAADIYRDAGRNDDALRVLRDQLARHPGPAALAMLLHVADSLGVARAERDQALAALERQAG